MKEKIRSKFVKESLLDYDNIAKSLKENTSNAVRDLLAEEVRKTYSKILSEDTEDDDFEVEEVEDTNDSENQDVADDTVETDTEMDSFDSDTDDSMSDTTSDIDSSIEGEGEDDGEDEWAAFDKYKISDDEYDFSNAEDDEIVKVYKLLRDDDQVLVTKDDNEVHIKDNETGAEYLVDLGGKGGEEGCDAATMADQVEEPEVDLDVDINAEGDLDNLDNDDDMNESRIFEIALNEYDSNVGYTDNYQSKDVMSNNGMKEPGKNVNDWDAGVPKGTKKPFAGNVKGTEKPFNEETEDDEVDETIAENSDEEAIEEANLSQSRWNDTHAAHNRVPAANKDEYRRKGMQKTSKGAKYRATGGDSESTNESVKKIMTKANAIFKENQELKAALSQFRKVLQEAAVTNVNLGKIIKLISENSTTKAEKQEIIARFGKDVKTVEQSDRLYETISRELQKNNTLSINEEKQFTTNSSKMINETQLYQSKDLMDSLDLMHRICK
jgi:hypothetical protein